MAERCALACVKSRAAHGSNPATTQYRVCGGMARGGGSATGTGMGGGFARCATALDGGQGRVASSSPAAAGKPSGSTGASHGLAAHHFIARPARWSASGSFASQCPTV